MDSTLENLIQRTRDGETDLLAELVGALQGRRNVELALLLDLAQSSEAVLRRAAIAGAQGRTEPELLEAMESLALDGDEAVRQDLAEALKETPQWSLDGAVERLLGDEEESVRQSAVEAARRRPSLEGALVLRLRQDDAWRVRQAIARGLAGASPRGVLPALVARLAEDGDVDVQQGCAASVEKHLAALGGYPRDLARPTPVLLQEAERRVKGLRGGPYPLLAAWLEERVAREIDLEPLRAFGTVLTAEADAGRLPRAYCVEDSCDTLLGVLRGAPPRAAVLLGDSGVGKTAIVYELAHRLLRDPDGPWHILRMSPTEFVTGTKYTGEWETRVNNLVNLIRSPRRIILYVPNLQELSAMGTWSKSDANVASALAPYIERGDVTILGESTPDAFRTGLGAVMSLRRLFHAVEVPESDPEETRNILQAVRAEARADMDEPVLDRLIELADSFLSGQAQPGLAVGLLRRVLGATAGRPGPISERDILATLSTASGIPVDFLDDRVALDRAKVRTFFEARVMGQPEAVDCVLDLVTLIKAGLTDPNKPFGVMLFVGPTGVGKTELARALAELLFGDPNRMIRLDMSEFATADAFERLIGWPARPGLLTSAVREHPFSVVLLDEIEKGHLNVFDLCLQIFDAGRLTDAQGRTTDFRRTIIILTSNIGSRVVREAPVGFGRGAPPPPDADSVGRELGRAFRPEFLNRIDRIVTFRPLAAEIAEKIARREVVRVLERSGITRRHLTIDVDPAVFPVLLREGYSPAFGARPLKRTVERMVLLPVAQKIAAGNVTLGSVLRLMARGGRIEVEVEAPETEADTMSIAPAARAIPVARRATTLVERAAALHDQAAPLAARKSELLAASAQANFWDNRAAAQAVYDDIYRIDGLLSALENLSKAARNEAESAERARHSDRDLARIEERLEGLESQARHLAFLVTCREARDLGDALVTLTLATSHGAGLNAVARLAQMYVLLGRRRGFEVEVLADRQGGDPAEDVIVLQVSGVGAFALLEHEGGLHQLTRGMGEAHTGQRRPLDRDLVRVEVFPVPAGEVEFSREEVREEIHSLGEIAGRLLARPRFDVQLLHLPSLTSVRAWTDGTKAKAVERLRPLLRARVEAAQQASAEGGGRQAVVRRYSLGPAALVRDVRSGRSTGRLDQVLDGHLDLFLTPPDEGSGS